MKAHKVEKQNMGLQLTKDLEYQSGSSVLMLLGRGLLLFMVVYGTVGCFTSSFDIPFNKTLVFFTLLFVDVFLGIIFYREWTKNVGYIALFIVFVGTILMGARYVVSGFYGVVNLSFERIGAMMDLSNVMSYTEIIPDRELAITIFIIFCGVGISTLLNALISNYMSVGRTMICTLPFALAGLYVSLIPNFVDSGILLTGYLILYAMKKSRHYHNGEKGKDFRVVEKKDSTRFYYHSSGKIMLQVMALFAVIGFSFLLLMNFLFPSQKIGKSASLAGIRNTSDTYVARFVSGGFLGLFNQYSGAGGMSGGRLGGAAFVSPDYETDLIASFVPYCKETMYLRGYIGISYAKNRWNTATTKTSVSGSDHEREKNINREAREIKETKAKKHTMTITNIDADPAYHYIPYYTMLKESDLCQFLDFEVVSGKAPLTKSYSETFYPQTDGVFGTDLSSSNQLYSYIPEDNFEVIANFCKEAGLRSSEGFQKIRDRLAGYFQAHYPYTKRPGIMPRNKDFVNYFLAESKTGFCAHFASAATLIFRYLGYESRYVEGYCIPYSRVVQAVAKSENEEVQVEIDDSCAHAWVEVFIPGFGWKVVDVTPASRETEEGATSMGFLESLIGGGRAGAEVVTNQSDEWVGLSSEHYRIVLVGVICLAGLVLIFGCGILGRRFYRRYLAFHDPNRSIAASNRYQYQSKKWRKKYAEFSAYTTYRQQMNAMTLMYPQLQNECERLEVIMNKASYSADEISQEEYENVLVALKKLK